MTASTHSKFPWKKGSIILLILISAILAFDCRKHGTFEASSTGKFLKNSGITEYGQKFWSATKMYTSKGLEIVEESSPEYYKATIDFCTPYIKLAGDLYITTKNLSLKVYNNTATYVAKNGPVLLQTIDYYVPGMQEKLYLRSTQALELVKEYSTVAGEKVVEHSNVVIQWVKTNVFVGKFSPESLQNYATQAIDTTQTLASQTYDWVYEKVQTLSKLP